MLIRGGGHPVCQLTLVAVLEGKGREECECECE